MSERPFMQLYVSDFIGDTLHLSTEQIGAYMLLLMAMWNAGGTLPGDDAKLARIVRMSLKKWRGISDDLMTYFDISEGVISHNRLTKELRKSERKSELRASAGAKGGAAKSLKNNNLTVANAKQMHKHLPDTIQKEELRSSKKARQIPKDFQPDIEWAVTRGLSRQIAEIEAEKFVNYWIGEGKPKKDWAATWRTWVLKALQYRSNARASSRQESKTDQAGRKFIERGFSHDTQDETNDLRNVFSLPAIR